MAQSQEAVSERRTAVARRRDQKRQRRTELAEERLRQAQAARRRQLAIWGAGVAVVVGALVALGVWLFGPQPTVEVQSLAIQGQQHIKPGEAHPPYNSTPPTSGWHYETPAPWGVSSAPIPDEVQVHNLEHGGIMVQYHCPTGCPEVVRRLEAVVKAYRSKVILAPYPRLPSDRRIALTAWGKVAYLDEPDEARVRWFIEKHKDKGPEFIPD